MQEGVYLDKEYKTDADDGAAFFLQSGPDPSQGWITLSDTEAAAVEFDKDGHRLTFSDGTNDLDIEHLYILRGEDAGEGITRLILGDLRYFWKRRYITRYYNQLNDDKETFNPQTTKTDSSTNGWTFREIIEDLLDALTDVPDGYHKPGTVYDKAKLDEVDTATVPLLVDKSIEFASAGDVLVEYLAQVGGSVHVNFGGEIVISMPEDDEFSSHKSGLEDAVTTKTLPDAKAYVVDKPKYVQVKYKILREKLFENKYWEPVLKHNGLGENGEKLTGQEADEWLPVATVLEDWGWTEEDIQDSYFGIDEALNPDEDPKTQANIEIIKAQFYKYFRFRTPGTSSTEARNQILPFQRERGTHVEPNSGESWATGIYCFETKVSYPIRVDDKLALKEAHFPSSGPVLEDPKEGIVRFPGTNPITECEQIGEGFTAQDFKLYEPSQIQIVMPFLKKFQDTNDLANDYYNAGDDDEGYADEWTGLPDNEDTHVLLDVSRYYIERALTGGSFTAYNEEEIDAVAEKAAEDFFRSFLKKEPQDIEIGLYNTDITRLCGVLRGIHVYGNATDGYGITYRLHDDTPINEYSRNFRQDITPDHIVGETIETRHTNPSFAGTGRNRTGITEIASTYGKSSEVYSDKQPGTLINPQHVGVLPAEDLSHTLGGGDVDHRARHTRITKHLGTRAETTFTRKNAITPSWGRAEWEAVLVTPSKVGKKTKPEDKPEPTAPPPQVTPRPGGYVPGGVAGEMGAGATIPVPRPQPGTQPGQKPKPAEGNESTYIWTESPEGKQVKKGPLRDVLMVGEHRKRGKDPDGHQICWAEIDKNTAMHHRSDELCGPLIDSGKHLRPEPDGPWVYTEQIYDPRVKGWVYRTTVPVGGFGVPPGPTPNPPGPPGPPPTGPSPDPTGGPGGGGGGVPNSETPTLDPPPPFPPSWPAPPDDPGWDLPPEWGPAPGEPNTDPADGGGGGNAGGGGQPVGAGGDPVPGEDPFWGPPGPRPGDPDYQTDNSMGPQWQNSYGYGGDWSHAAPVENRNMRMIPGNSPDTWHNQITTQGSSVALSPYFPGTGMSESVQHQAHGRSPYFPGTPPMNAVDETAFTLDAAPSALDWDDTTLSDERYSQNDYESQTFGQGVFNLTNTLNTLSSRIGTLDARDRANYNTQASVSLPAGDTTVDYSPSTVYSSAPTAVVTQACSLTAHDYGAISCTVTADGDGTYTFGIEAENVNAAAPQNISIDIKGPVADTEDIDP